MGLLSIFQRNKQASAKSAQARGGKPGARQAPLAGTRNPADTAEAVREARARARTRLMGATVLLLVGVIGFPLLFETQPRPIPVDLPIEIPARNAPGLADAGIHARAQSVPSVLASAPALLASGPKPESVTYDARSSAPVAASEPASEPAPHRSAFASLAAAFTSSPAGNANAPASPADASPAAAQAKPAARPEKHAASVAAPVPAASKPVAVPHVVVLPPPPASTSSPAAILTGAPPAKPSDAAGAGRFIVQVGAFLDDAKVRETRAKVEKLGMKTYTQPVDTPTGKRTRVRVGPYATKAEADKIAARLKGDGLQAVVLTL
jgi:DedD protein